MVERAVVGLRRSNDIIVLHFVEWVVGVDTRRVRCNELLLRKPVFDLLYIVWRIQVDLFPFDLFS